jgi:hypothetical protein
MNKGKVLSAAAVANMAAVGFAAAPAIAGTHPAADTAGAVAAAVPSAGRAHPGITFVPGASGSALTKARAAALANAGAGELARAGAAVIAAKPHGFVPRPPNGVKPSTETGCSGHVCLGLYGGGEYVSYVNEHWFSGTGCHLAHFGIYSPNEVIPGVRYSPPGYYCSKQEATWKTSRFIYSKSSICGYFNNIAGFMCEEVR